MVEDLTKVFKEMLPGNDWMDQPTKDAADKKADQITPIIAYPDYILNPDDTQLDDDYADINVITEEYFKSIQDLVVRSGKISFGKLRVAVDFDE